MSTVKNIKITKKDGTSHIVPAGQRSQYESFNEKNTKLKKLKDVVTITDIVEEETSAAGSGNGGTGVDTPKTAKDLIAAISMAETAADVDAIVPEGEARTTVLTAAADRKAELKG